MGVVGSAEVLASIATTQERPQQRACRPSDGGHMRRSQRLSRSCLAELRSENRARSLCLVAKCPEATPLPAMCVCAIGTCALAPRHMSWFRASGPTSIPDHEVGSLRQPCWALRAGGIGFCVRSALQIQGIDSGRGLIAPCGFPRFEPGACRQVLMFVGQSPHRASTFLVWVMWRFTTSGGFSCFSLLSCCPTSTCIGCIRVCGSQAWPKV